MYHKTAVNNSMCVEITRDRCVFSGILYAMFPEAASAKPPQLPLFTLEESMGKVEVFPAVWLAIEDLTSPESGIKQQALERLQILNAPRFFPVVTYLLFTLITEQDLQLRKRIVQTLAEILAPDEQGLPAPDNVRNNLLLNLSQIRTRQIYALLQVIIEDDSLEKDVARLFDACPYAGNHLLDILGDYRMPLEVRKQAVNMIGRVGYLDAIPPLERLASRLATRLNGQQLMPFAPPPGSNEAELLPAVQASLEILHAT